MDTPIGLLCSHTSHQIPVKPGLRQMPEVAKCDRTAFEMANPVDLGNFQANSIRDQLRAPPRQAPGFLLQRGADSDNRIGRRKKVDLEVLSIPRSLADPVEFAPVIYDVIDADPASAPGGGGQPEEAR